MDDAGPAGRFGSAILSTTEMYEADQAAAVAGVDGFALMRNAGSACADAIVERFDAGRATVLCGPGNNGGDGFVVARRLKESGWSVRLALLGERSKLKGDAAVAADHWHGEIARLDADMLVGADLIVDALFGAGLSRPIEGAVAEIVEKVGASKIPVCAIDIPSGIVGDTGQVAGVAARANVTITFFRKKPGHVLYPGRSYCGDIVVADIGIPEAVLKTLAPRLAENRPDLWLGSMPAPQRETHKYHRGHALVISGDAASTGAARLGARAALRSGAGLVTVASPRDALTVNAAHLTAIMLKSFGGAKDLARLLEDRRINAVLAGPGMGIGCETRASVRAVLASGAAAVLDADALTSFESCPEQLFEAVQRDRDRQVVLTPHGGEFARLFPAVENASSKIERAQMAAHMSSSVVVLKGADTVIASPDGRAAVNVNAGPELATAGSGDVLAGLIAGLLAQHMPVFEGASAAVWLHGEAGALVGPGLISEDLPEAVPQVWRRLRRQT